MPDPDAGILVERVEGDGFLVSIHGEHDLSTAPMLAQRFDELFAEGSFVVADLTKTRFLDSQILRVFLDEAKRSLKDPHERFALIVDVEQSHMQRVFDIARPVMGDIPTFASQQEALDEMRRRNGQ